ncbi:MAG: shikimate kinase, partial [Pontibacter sp.]|nr:shikimate kinase [Pontibacter sp.]
TSIYLNVPVEQLAQRLLAQGLEQRPLLAGKNPEELISFLTETLAQRMQFYERAKHILPLAWQNVARLRELLNL